MAYKSVFTNSMEEVAEAARETDASAKAVRKYNRDSRPVESNSKVDSCRGCRWSGRKRYQKCSCCRRNKYLRDCYENRK